MGLGTRGVGAGSRLAGGPWRAWLSLRGQGGVASRGRRGESTEPLRAAGRREQQRWKEEEEAFRQRQNKTVLSYLVAAAVGMAGMSYASVPLYRLFCQVSGYGGTTKESNSDKVETMEPIKDRIIKVTFNADVHATLNWNFRPQQTEIYVAPGETALAFYKAKNPTDKPIIGVSTYNVVPFEAGQYFNKIQCFCFEEQRLNPHEEVDMPVFFYIDPEIEENANLLNVDLITLSYTFFEAKGESKWSLPGFK